MKNCLVLGAAALDIVLRVERFAQADELVFPLSVRRMPGGSAANVACALGQLDVGTAFAGELGGDDAGRTLLEAFRKARVATDYVQLVQDAASGGAVVVVNDAGERLMYSLLGNVLVRFPDAIPSAAFEGLNALYVAEALEEVASSCVRRARTAGAEVYFAPGGMFCAQGYDGLPGFLDQADALFLSRTELDMLGGNDSGRHMISRLLERVACVYLTLGKEGCAYYARGERPLLQPALPVTAVDTTGAGDAFAAGVIAARLSGYSPARTLAFASAAAAIKVQQPGARASFTRQKVHELMKEFV